MPMIDRFSSALAVQVPPGAGGWNPRRRYIAGQPPLQPCVTLGPAGGWEPGATVSRGDLYLPSARV